MSDISSWKSTTLTWLFSLSTKLSSSKTHHSGHASVTVNGSTAAFVLCNLVILVLSTFYMVWRVYYKKKFLTESFKISMAKRLGHPIDEQENAN